MKNKRAITVISTLTPYVFGVLFTLLGSYNLHIVYRLIVESSQGIIKENSINAIPYYAVLILSLVILLGLFALNIFLVILIIKNKKILVSTISRVAFYIGIAFQIILPIVCVLPLSFVFEEVHFILLKLAQ